MLEQRRAAASSQAIKGMVSTMSALVLASSVDQGAAAGAITLLRT